MCEIFQLIDILTNELQLVVTQAANRQRFQPSEFRREKANLIMTKIDVLEFVQLSYVAVDIGYIVVL